MHRGPEMEDHVAIENPIFKKIDSLHLSVNVRWLSLAHLSKRGLVERCWGAKATPKQSEARAPGGKRAGIKKFPES